MLAVRKAKDRGHADHGWLSTHHTFSFADYRDPRFMGFGPLRVLNDDTVAAGAGFPPHDHRDMEILSYVLEGALAHKDSLGNGSVIRPGDVQRMSAGKGVTHSELNASKVEPVHFLQIWLLPERSGLPPGYEQRHFAERERLGRLRLVASPTGVDGSVRLQLDARVFTALLEQGQSISHAFAQGRRGWIHVATGQIEVNGLILEAGDGVALSDEASVRLNSPRRGEALLFDLGGPP